MVSREGEANREVGHIRFVTSRPLEVGLKPAKSRSTLFSMNMTNPLGLRIKTTAVCSRFFFLVEASKIRIDREEITENRSSSFRMDEGISLLISHSLLQVSPIIKRSYRGG